MKLNLQGHLKYWLRYDISEQIWIIVERAISMRRCFCSKFSNYGTIVATGRFMPKTFEKLLGMSLHANFISNLFNNDSTIIQTDCCCIFQEEGKVVWQLENDFPLKSRNVFVYTDCKQVCQKHQHDIYNDHLVWLIDRH